VFDGLFSVDLARITSRGEAEKKLAERVSEASVRQFLLKNLYRQNGHFAWRMNLKALHREYEQIAAAPHSKAHYLGPTQFIKCARSDYILESHRGAIGKLFPNASARVMEGVGLPMDAIKRLRGKLDGITVNDVFLAVASGAMRNYLLSKNELPAEPLFAMMPISLRSEASDGGNNVGVARTNLHTDLEDPLERLHACHDSAAAQKSEDSILNNEIPALTENLPDALTGYLLKLMPPIMNTVVSNVRGPAETQYLAGAELHRLYPVSIPVDRIGINHTGISYHEHMWLGVVACRDMLPDPEFYAQCIRDSFNELLQAAGLKAVKDPAFDNGVERTNP
jgi:WS/DGAT/MGAT family acyltransferase